MSTACTHCGDTGSLVKRLDGFLDCAFCMAAEQRVRLNRYTAELSATGDGRDWMIFQAGQMAPPDGFVLVPANPTPGMLEALAGGPLRNLAPRAVLEVREGYRRMLNAAPHV